GDQIKVYIQEVKSAHPEERKEGAKPRGPQIEVTRSSEGFLKRLFEEEIREIYDGTVVIKAIAREAGIRSKVAVTSANEDIDATGACIGPGGTRIQKVVAQLGNGKEKEKIDIINYSTNPACFIIEAVRPATVVGVALYPANEENATQKAVAVVRDGQLSIGIGRKASNVRLASRLTGWSIDVKEETTAKELGIEYLTSEEWIAKEEAERREREKAIYLAKAKEEAEKKAKEAEEAAKAKEEAPAAPVAEEKIPEPTPAPVQAPKANVKPEEFPEEAKNPVAAALEADRKAREEAEKKAKEEEQKAAEPTFVQTTTSIGDLEKELESAKEKKSKPVSKKRPRKITEEEVENVAVSPITHAQPAMPIYSEEEMAEIAEQEAEEANNEDFDEEIDYEDYDRYYDDDEGGRR
ncbi:MAG: hypothetical protein J5736_02985, partial [Bacilli bacterium]|nr:hypothetical protein [Bacilli bacterium]